MKKIAIILTVFAATVLFFSACGKYEEGPSFSLLTKKSRIVGTWVKSEQTINGIVQNAGIFLVKFTFEKDGTGKTTVTIAEESVSKVIEWEFNDAKDILRIRNKNEDTGEWNDWLESEIIKLTNSELWTRVAEVKDGVTEVTITKMKKE